MGLEPRVLHDFRFRKRLHQRLINNSRPGRRQRHRRQRPDRPREPPVPDPGPDAGPELLGARVGLEPPGLRRRPGDLAGLHCAGGPAPGPAGQRLGLGLARRVPGPPARDLQPAARRPARLRPDDARRERAEQGRQLQDRVVRVRELSQREHSVVRLARAPGRRPRSGVRGLRRGRRLRLRPKRPVLF